MRDLHDTKDLFRPEFEFRSGIAYAVASGITLITAGDMESISVPLVLSAGLALKSIRCILTAIPRIKEKKNLKYNYFLFEPLHKIRKWNIMNKNSVYIGMGFEWGPEHAAKYHRVASMTTSLEELSLPLLFSRESKRKADITEQLGGKPWIHGLGHEIRVYQKASGFYGHTFICGLPGTGKTTLLNLLSTGTLNRGSFNLIIDPKPDVDWEKRMRDECELLGLPFHYFSTSHPSKSCRIDPLRDFERVSDIPTRITSVAGANTDDDPYVQYTWKCINQVVQGMDYVGIPAQLRSVSYYLRFQKDKLAILCLDRFYTELFGSKENARNKIAGMKNPDGKNGDLIAQMIYYEQLPESDRKPAVDGIVSFASQSRDHVSKMIGSTEPLFDKLTSSPLDKLLSPNINEVMEDGSYILNVDEMLETGGCLYISLNTMADSVIAGAIGKLILSTVASSASKRYAHDEGEGRRVALFVDEAHACLNEKLIDLMAVGRGAKFEIYLSTQTVPDLEAKSDAATAKRILGLASNMFALRVSDEATQKWVSANFGSIDVDTYSYQRSNRSSSSDSLIDDQSGGFAETFAKSEKELFPPVALGNMPNLQYIARMQSGMKIKGRIPILKK
ncbi:conjugative transfer system coupling protein TraD [Aliivibrio fischeri]|uniref:conjugative transfer system coupling protein TraD n=1 Tax=Aliivibrio fischeri TaxID=668 RepID=UPI0012D9ADA1|nr:conjugative transfer system coupling protein TraD [Aliivibrio fischeri]MUJ20387.1 conjugative transfer system coupling protein TraD [Aliivibrio fischeri]